MSERKNIINVIMESMKDDAQELKKKDELLHHCDLWFPSQ